MSRESPLMREPLFDAVLATFAFLIIEAPINSPAAHSFEQSCTGITAEGHTVHALCRDHRGAMVPTEIDVRGCVGDVGNDNGHLVSTRRGGGALGGFFQPGIQSTSCTAPANAACGGCSVACPPGKQAVCKEGEDHGVTSPLCWTKAKCECN
jgi:hypothetical protein